MCVDICILRNLDLRVTKIHFFIKENLLALKGLGGCGSQVCFFANAIMVNGELLGTTPCHITSLNGTLHMMHVISIYTKYWFANPLEMPLGQLHTSILGSLHNLRGGGGVSPPTLVLDDIHHRTNPLYFWYILVYFGILHDIVVGRGNLVPHLYGACMKGFIFL